MNRDMDVIRKIVLASRDSDDPLTSLEGVEDNIFGFNAMLLDEAGLAKCLISMDGDGATPTVSLAVVWRLTWDGFDFADAINDDTIWNKAKEYVLKPAGSWTFGLLLEYAKYEVKKKLNME